MRSVQIVVAHWPSLLVAYLGPTAVGVAIAGAAALARTRLPWGLVLAIVLVVVEPLMMTALALAVAVALGIEVPRPARFSSSVRLWPEQAKIVIPGVFVAFALAGIAGAGWQAGWSAFLSPSLEAAGLAVFVVAGIAAAAIGFLTMAAAVFVAVEDTPAATALRKTFGALFVRNAWSGLSAALIFAVIVLGFPAIFNAPIFSHVPYASLPVPLRVLVMGALLVVVNFGSIATAVTFALLFARREVLA